MINPGKDSNGILGPHKIKSVCYQGIEEKFKQNPLLMEYLLQTEEKTIVESSYDNIWHTGVPLSNDGSLNPRKWRGQGLLGEMLEMV